jgi:hypothetical protein
LIPALFITASFDSFTFVNIFKQRLKKKLNILHLPILHCDPHLLKNLSNATGDFKNLKSVDVP